MALEDAQKGDIHELLSMSNSCRPFLIFDAAASWGAASMWSRIPKNRTNETNENSLTA